MTHSVGRQSGAPFVSGPGATNNVTTNFTGGPWTFTRTAVAAPSNAADFTIVTGAHTALTASTEAPAINLNTSATRQFATGAVTLQRNVRVQAPTYSFVGASTMSDAATLAIDGPPVAGTNATITRSYALVLGAPVATTSGAIGSSTSLGIFSTSTNLAQVVLRNASNELCAQLTTQGYIGTATATTFNLMTSNAIRLTLSALGKASFTPGAASSGVAADFTVTAATNTGQTASTESTAVNFNLAATKTWVAGALTTQRDLLIQAPTYAFASASTITNAATVAIAAAPTAGTNATITNAHAFWIQAGNAQFDGGATFGLRANLKSYTVATLPAAGVAGGLIYVSDETGGAVPAFSDSTNWRRVTDRAIVA